MCRSQVEGGRRCPGAHGSHTATQRKRLSRARQALASATAAGDSAAIAKANDRVLEAQDDVLAAKINAGLDRTKTGKGGLAAVERTAVSNYSGGEFGAINAYVQNGYQVPSYAANDREFVTYMKTTVAALERAVGRSKLSAPTRATRAIYANTATAAYGPVGSAVGETITEARFTSATTNDKPSKEFGDVTIVYNLAPGTKALDINSSGVPCKRDENELLVGPHQPLRMVSDHIVAGQRVITMESASLPPQT